MAIWTAIEAWRGDFPEREPQNLAAVLWIVGGLAVQMLTMTHGRLLDRHRPAVRRDRQGFGKRPLWMTIPIGIVFSFVVWVIFARACSCRCPPVRSNSFSRVRPA